MADRLHEPPEPLLRRGRHFLHRATSKFGRHELQVACAFIVALRRRSAGQRMAHVECAGLADTLRASDDIKIKKRELDDSHADRPAAPPTGRRHGGLAADGDRGRCRYHDGHAAPGGLAPRVGTHLRRRPRP